MAAVFEIHLKYKHSISLSAIVDILKRNYFTYSIESMESMDNWEYENHQTHNNQSINDIDSLIQNQNKVFIIEGLLNSKYRFGINFSSEYCFDFWITTKGIEQLDSNYITNRNIEIYEKLKYQFTECLDTNFLTFCGMGSEVLMPESVNTESIVNDSKNVCMWIFPNERFDAILDNFEKEIINDFFVYSLKV